MRTLKQLILYVLLIAAALVVLCPFLWMVATALKVPGTAEKLQFLPFQKISLAMAGRKDFLRAGVDLNELQTDQLQEKILDLYSQHHFPSMKEAREALADVIRRPLNQTETLGFEQVFSNRLDINTLDKRQLVDLAGLRDYEAKALLRYRQNTGELDGAHELGSIPLMGQLRMKRLLQVFQSDASVIDRLEHPGYTELLELADEELDLYLNLRDSRKGPFQSPEDLAQIRLFSKERVQELSDRFFSNKLYTLANFKKVLFEFEPRRGFTIRRAFINSLAVAIGTALLTVFLCTLGGYVFARKEFTGKNLLYGMFWASMLIPGMMFVVPQYAVVSILGGINSYWAMIVPHTANIFGLYLMRQTIEGIPASLFEAAALDGASESQVLRIIVLPLSLPIMATLFLMTFLGQWSNFLWQLIVNTPDSMNATLPVTLALFRGQYSTDWTILMAGASLMILPVVILFLMSQRFFIQGITQGAVKE